MTLTTTKDIIFYFQQIYMYVQVNMYAYVAENTLYEILDIYLYVAINHKSEAHKSNSNQLW